MRISDWSSDVCSSDLQGREALAELEPLANERREEICRSAHVYQRLLERARQAGRLAPNWSPEIAAITLYSTMMGLLDQWLRAPARFDARKVGVDCINQQIGRASCGVRVCQYVEISVVAVS